MHERRLATTYARPSHHYMVDVFTMPVDRRPPHEGNAAGRNVKRDARSSVRRSTSKVSAYVPSDDDKNPS
jgi:hypothetical protein